MGHAADYQGDGEHEQREAAGDLKSAMFICLQEASCNNEEQQNTERDEYGVESDQTLLRGCLPAAARKTGIAAIGLSTTNSVTNSCNNSCHTGPARRSQLQRPRPSRPLPLRQA
jgi:hypothetical protein